MNKQHKSLSYGSLRYGIRAVRSMKLHPKIVRSFVLSKSESLRHILYPPIVFEQNNVCYVVGRQWVFAYYIYNDIKDITVLIIDDESLLNDILDYDSQEVKRLLKTTANADRTITESLSKTFQNNNSKSREDAKKAGQTCPFCKAITPLRRTKIQVDGDKSRFIVSCDNKFRSGKYRCNFFAELSEYEYQKFISHEFPTELWIWIVHASHTGCQCGARLMRRRIYTTEDDFEEYSECENYHRFEDVKLFNGKCDYSIKCEAFKA